MRFVYGNAKYFREIVKALNVFADEANFEATFDGLNCKFMDPSHVAMVKLELSRECFDTFLVEESKVFCLNLTHLVRKVFRNVYPSDLVQVSIGDGEATFTLFSDLKREFKTTLLDALEEELPEPKLSPDARVKLVLKGLEKVLKDVSNFGDEVVLTCSGEGLSFDVNGGDDAYHVAIDRNCDHLLRVEANGGEPQKAGFNVAYLNDLLKAFKPLVDVVTLEYSTDMPLKVKADLNYGSLTFWLAPRIRGD